MPTPPQILLLLLLLICLPCQDLDDIIDISNLTFIKDPYTPKLRAGYLNIVTYNVSFYYLFAQSQNSPDKDPVILWLNGGPGCSSLTGFFTENGPFSFPDDDPTSMYLNPHAWNKQANVLYLESPGSVGFSTASPKYLNSNDSSVAKDNLKALQLFFIRYHDLRKNDFYIAGESYAGIYIPRLAEEILDYNEGMQETRINLRGILIGNACTHPYECTTPTYYSRFTSEFLYTRGFLQETLYNQYKTNCLTNEKTASCIAVQKTIRDNFLATGASIYNIYGKCYPTKFPPGYEEIESYYLEHLERYHQTEHGLKHPLRCTNAGGPITVLNANEYRDALKVGKYNDTLKWTPCSDTINYTMQSKATYSTLPTLINAGLKIFYFTGDMDAIVPITGTLYWFDKYRTDYGVAIKKSWRPWVSRNQNTSGMVWELDSMTLATVRGAGHMVPTDKPAEAEEILNVFLDRNPWKLPDYYIE